MNKDDKIKLFQQSSVRTHWDAEQEKWFFSIVDVIAILTDSERPRKYWSDLKSKLKKEGSELSENIGQLKMQASDGKKRATDVADTQQLFRLIQSIPSPKAEPFKLWVAKVAKERIDEFAVPLCRRANFFWSFHSENAGDAPALPVCDSWLSTGLTNQ